ncbi:protein kinase [Gemmatirosa kalamazoonensis]|uniref:Protein kinase n=1 Tax=Gemmatirosa kalamazoonensis TaxID=861299 RepID=W0RBU7_9BACT|nr:serine/threonine-protein kinase [Gemmatirosa kalamazoonensis]AHG87785.1 protein kinase [Gemmatirosa kalamazoonensis]
MLTPGIQLGPYEIQETLGQGGMGEVYRARDLRLGRELALKLLPTRVAADETAVERFVREARAASALNHPNVVTIYEIGEAEPGRYIAMELVGGTTLRPLTARPQPVEQVARIGAQIARALAVAHADGIIHRDIKPDNVMLRPDGYVKVLDFGIARLVAAQDGRATGAEAAPTQAGRAVGTVRYMSPEQACAEPLTGATDVFSLGVVLYELATGRHPFAAMPNASDVAVLSAMLTGPAPTATAANPAVPRELDVLLARMLEREPRQRPSAAEVEAALAGLTLGATPAAARRDAPSERHTVGRDGERAALRQAMADAERGHGALLSVAGEPGIGKTTLVEAFLAEVASATRPCRIARGRCSERLAGTEAYLPILEALDAMLRGAGASTVAALMRRHAPTWYLQLAPAAAEDSSEGRALMSVQASSQERLKRELGTFLDELSRTSPVVLFLDDLHWADASTVDVLAYLAARLDAMRLLIVVTVRPAELLLGRHPFAQLKLDLQARGLCHELALEFLTVGDVEQYLRLEFPGHDFPPDFAALIHAKTDGSPLFMADLLRYLRTRGVVASADERWTLARPTPVVEVELPESIRGMIQRKIEQLGDDDRRLLTAAGVQGYEFDSAIVAALTGTDPADVEERLETLEHVYGFVKRARASTSCLTARSTCAIASCTCSTRTRSTRRSRRRAASRSASAPRGRSATHTARAAGRSRAISPHCSRRRGTRATRRSTCSSPRRTRRASSRARRPWRCRAARCSSSRSFPTRRSAPSARCCSRACSRRRSPRSRGRRHRKSPGPTGGRTRCGSSSASGRSSSACWAAS